MQKQKPSFKEQFIFSFACLIAFAVFLLSLHAKDLMKYREAEATEVKYNEVATKASTDLHDHVDKQIMKSFAKSVGDNALLSSRSRDDIDAYIDEDPGLWGRLSERFLLWGIYLTMPFSRIV